MIYTLIRKDASDSVQSIISFDSISSMDESWTAQVSSYTVESGFNITDNVNIEPTTYSIDAIISGYSLFRKGSEITWDGEGFSSEEDLNLEHLYARDEIIETFKSGAVLTILESSASSNHTNLDTKLTELYSGTKKEIDNCVMTSLSISHPSGGTGAFFVSIKLQKIEVALIETHILKDDELSPAVRPMKENTDNEASSSKTESEEGDTTNSNNKTGEQVSAESVPPFKKSNRDSQGAGEIRATERKNVYKSQINAYKDMMEAQSQDGIPRDLIQTGTGWSWRYRM